MTSPRIWHGVLRALNDGLVDMAYANDAMIQDRFLSNSKKLPPAPSQLNLVSIS